MPSLFAQESRAALRRRVGSLYQPDRFGYGQVLTATASSVTCEFAKRISSGVLRGRTLYVVSGTGVGQSADISDNTVGTGAIAVTPSFGVTPDSTSVIEIWADGIDPEDVNAALNLAVLEASDLCHVRVDEGVPLINETYKILVPHTTWNFTIDATRKILSPDAAWTYLVAILYSMPDGQWREYKQSPEPGYINGRGDLLYTVVGGQIFLSHALPADAQTILSGYRRPNLLDADTTLCEIPSDFAVFSACLYLDMGLTSGPVLDPEAHAGRSAGWMRSSLVARAKLGTDWEPTCVRLRP